MYGGRWFNAAKGLISRDIIKIWTYMAQDQFQKYCS